MPTIKNPTPPHPDCALPYHKPGSNVRFQRWNSAQDCMENLWGEVVAHRPDYRVIVIATPVGELTISCGSVVAA